MNARTRDQLLELNRIFYEAHAEAFDRSRGARPWPGWQRLAARLAGLSSETPAPPALPLPPSPPRDLGSVLDIGCGNGRFACFLHEAGFRFRYTGVDANAALLEAARRQLAVGPAAEARLIRHDFLAGGAPGAGLPAGPFELIVLMGVLHHVPGAEGRLALLRAATARLARGGLLALAIWQFADDPREARKRVAFASAGRVLGHSIDESQLEPGDALLRFGADPTAPPRYCHAVTAAELESWPDALGLEPVDDYEDDGPHGRSNRYAVLRQP
ncbi:MAG: class I SAM-dependent methyltransferase [Myxococcota bacterium]